MTESGVRIHWTPGVDEKRLTALTVHILESGWLRVQWGGSTPSISYVPPWAVQELSGKGVITSDA